MTGIDRPLQLWAFFTGVFLFAPALAIPGLPVPLQPLDVLSLAGWPLALLVTASLTRAFGWIAISLLASQGLSLLVAGGQVLVLAHSLLFVLPFLVLTFTIARRPEAAAIFVRGLLAGAGLSIVLFVAQMILGTERLDFRTHTGFSLPAQYGRAFALFPEVSTYAVHMIVAMGLCLALLAGPPGVRSGRIRLWIMLGLGMGTLVATRSSSLLLLMPPMACAAILMGRRLSPRGLLVLLSSAVLCALFLALFVQFFYADRLESASAARSAQMRLASVLGGLSPLLGWEPFGVGLGENHLVTRRAFDIARQLDLRFGALPQGINSHIVSRIFEEGWPAVLGMAGAGLLLLRVVLDGPGPGPRRLLVLVAIGSFLAALLVIGYRGIYLNWLWLSLPAGLLSPYLPVNRQTTPTVLKRMAISSQRFARRA